MEQRHLHRGSETGKGKGTGTAMATIRNTLHARDDASYRIEQRSIRWSREGIN